LGTDLGTLERFPSTIGVLRRDRLASRWHLVALILLGCGKRLVEDLARSVGGCGHLKFGYPA